MQKNLINYNVIILYSCIPFFLVTECRLEIIRERRQLDPYIQYPLYVPSFSETGLETIPIHNNDPCINLEMSGCREQYLGTQYFLQQMSEQLQTQRNVAGNPNMFSVWPFLFPQITQIPQQNFGYNLNWPYNNRQLTSSIFPFQPINEPQTTSHDQAANESKNNMGDSSAETTATVPNPEISSHSQQVDLVQNDPIKYNHQVLKTSSSVTNPKTLNIVRTFTGNQEDPVVSIREETPSETESEKENGDRQENPADNPTNEETINRNQEENIQESQENVQRQNNTVSNNSETKEKIRKQQNQSSNDEENDEEYYYEYLH